MHRVKQAERLVADTIMRVAPMCDADQPVQRLRRSRVIRMGAGIAEQIGPDGDASGGQLPLVLIGVEDQPTTLGPSARLSGDSEAGQMQGKPAVPQKLPHTRSGCGAPTPA